MSDHFHEGQYIVGEVTPITANEQIPPIFDYIEYDFNKHSVWELFLLSKSYIFLPLYWHAAYAEATYIFERADLEQVVSTKIMHWDMSSRTKIDITHKVAAYLDDETILPEITIVSENEAHIRCTYWSHWFGLFRTNTRIIKENITTTITLLSTENLVEYDCGMVL